MLKTYAFLIFAAFIGMARGAVSLVVEHPLDTIKTYWQAYPARPSFKIITKEIYRLKGWKGFYSGMVPNLLRAMLKQGYRYPLMLVFPIIYGKVFSSIAVISFMTGLSIAALEVWIIVPLERFKVWLMTFQRVSGGVRAFLYHFKNDAFHMLYKGLSATALKQVVSWVTFLGAHDQLMYVAKNELGCQVLPLGILLLISLADGACNTLMVMPLDCIKTNMQKSTAAGRNRKLKGVAHYIYKTYGIKGFYRGWEIRLVQYMLHSVFTLSALEWLKDQLGSF